MLYDAAGCDGDESDSKSDDDNVNTKGVNDKFGDEESPGDDNDDQNDCSTMEISITLLSIGMMMLMMLMMMRMMITFEGTGT